ncbi:MAG: hypothetical protein ABI168_11300 [Ginsengibacter sp.]
MKSAFAAYRLNNIYITVNNNIVAFIIFKSLLVGGTSEDACANS